MPIAPKDPMPLPTGIEAIVCNDIARRQQFGINKYGTTVADNPLDLYDWLRHAYEETLDKAIYLRRTMEQIERDRRFTTAQQMSAIHEAVQYLNKLSDAIENGTELPKG